MTKLTDALALSKLETDPTPDGPCGRFRQSACTGDDGPCPHCKGWCVCGFRYADHFRGFGGNTQTLAPGMRRVVRA